MLFFDLKITIFFTIKSIKNSIKTFFVRDISSYYLPNLLIKNVVLIDPNKIEYVDAIPMKFHRSTQFIQNFNFDKKNNLVDEYNHPTFVTCKELFTKGIDIDKCSEFFYFKEQISKNREFKNCKNDNDIILFLKKKIELFESIKKIGIKKTFVNNIQFMIDENCNLVKINGGNHRFCIARILKLKKIPIEIKLIHSKNFEENFNKKIEIKVLNKFIKQIEDRYA